MATAALDRPARARAPKTKPADAANRLKQIQRAAILLKQASDPTRLRVLTMLAEGELHVGAICGVLDQSQPAVSHHLALLRHGGLVMPRRAGKNNYYGLTDAGAELARMAGRLIDGSA